MAVKLQGNHAPYRNGVRGIGAASVPDGVIGWFGATSQADGDVAYVSVSELASNSRLPQLGFAFQAKGGSVKVAFTLSNAGLATDPDPAVQESVVWDTAGELTVPGTGAITMATIPVFSALRLTFATAGTEFYAAAK
ncbi:hypothetical protein BcepSauron_086 [Burkholderia phage BcepSauron]|uniref:Uncharacterized protein n=1 Tax=Burkholderia phage BcepSauron TaxID=2530033 RepID=A0A482MLU3_9CAUD|nr:hypothetical protein H1O17_gp086 [Burkholderia phage BcepSauron]QBQ74466.1 hypothetical protein BcepSauron_086 [Burkholderia phage BcepSauron]